MNLEGLWKWLADHTGPLLVAQTLALVVLLAALAAALRGVARLRGLLAALLADTQPGPLHEVLEEHLRGLREMRREQRAMREALEAVGESQRGCIQRVGLVRYDAFEDIGGLRSFALALLDERGNGAVLNCVSGRDTSSLYAKPVAAGQSTIPLTDEERQAIREACEGAGPTGP